MNTKTSRDLALTGRAIVVAEATASDGTMRYIPLGDECPTTDLVQILCAWLNGPPHPATIVAEPTHEPYCNLHADATYCESCLNIAAHVFPHDCDAQPHDDNDLGIDADGRCHQFINSCQAQWKQDGNPVHDHTLCIRQLGRHAG